jgi:arylsulfatase A-like enzyme
VNSAAFLSRLAWLPAALCVLAAVAATSASAATPNILVIVTDDQRARTLDVMPKTRDWFKAGGRTFNRAFATTPLCCPSRASIFTGRYAHNHGVTANDRTSAFAADTSVQRYLADAGYATAIVGKYFNGIPLAENPPPFARWMIGGGTYNDPAFNVDGTVQTVPGYSTEIVAAGAVQLLQDFEADDERPWFLYVAPKAPHLPATPAPRNAEAPVPAWVPSSALVERDRSDKPPWVRKKPLVVESAVATRSAQLRTLMSVDDLVGDVMGTLESLGERRETLAFFLSDHGFLWGEHGLMRKSHPYTESIRIPFFMAWPGSIPEGSRDNRFAATVDIAPTILDAADVAPAIPMDGRSLLGRGWRAHLFTEYFRTPEFRQVPPWKSIRTGRFQYVEYYGNDPTRIIFREYYRLDRDPEQLRNVLRDGNRANDPDTRRLHRLLRLYGRCSGASCP